MTKTMTANNMDRNLKDLYLDELKKLDLIYDQELDFLKNEIINDVVEMYDSNGNMMEICYPYHPKTFSNEDLEEQIQNFFDYKYSNLVKASDLLVDNVSYDLDVSNLVSEAREISYDTYIAFTDRLHTVNNALKSNLDISLVREYIRTSNSYLQDCVFKAMTSLSELWEHLEG